MESKPKSLSSASAYDFLTLDAQGARNVVLQELEKRRFDLAVVWLGRCDRVCVRGHARRVRALKHPGTQPRGIAFDNGNLIM